MNQTAHALPHQAPRAVSVAAIDRGQLFKLTADNTHIYALLHHEKAPLADGAVRWGVVIDSQPGHVGRKDVGAIVQLSPNALCHVVVSTGPALYRVL